MLSTPLSVLLLIIIGLLTAFEVSPGVLYTIAATAFTFVFTGATILVQVYSLLTVLCIIFKVIFSMGLVCLFYFGSIYSMSSLENFVDLHIMRIPFWTDWDDVLLRFLLVTLLGTSILHTRLFSPFLPKRNDSPPIDSPPPPPPKPSNVNLFYQSYYEQSKTQVSECWTYITDNSDLLKLTQVHVLSQASMIMYFLICMRVLGEVLRTPSPAEANQNKDEEYEYPLPSDLAFCCLMLAVVIGKVFSPHTLFGDQAIERVGSTTLLASGLAMLVPAFCLSKSAASFHGLLGYSIYLLEQFDNLGFMARALVIFAISMTTDADFLTMAIYSWFLEGLYAFISPFTDHEEFLLYYDSMHCFVDEDEHEDFYNAIRRRDMKIENVADDDELSVKSIFYPILFAIIVVAITVGALEPILSSLRTTYIHPSMQGTVMNVIRVLVCALVLVMLLLSEIIEGGNERLNFDLNPRVVQFVVLGLCFLIAAYLLFGMGGEKKRKGGEEEKKVEEGGDVDGLGLDIGAVGAVGEEREEGVKVD